MKIGSVRTRVSLVAAVAAAGVISGLLAAAPAGAATPVAAPPTTAAPTTTAPSPAPAPAPEPKSPALARSNVTPSVAANDPNCTFYPQTGHSVCGAIRDHYNALGGPNGFLGYPTSDELGTPNGAGRYNVFQGYYDHIYWSPATGAHEIGGAIFQQWGNSGYETGPLGYPTTDERVAPDGTRRYNNFVGGSIVWSPVDGAITDLYPVSDTLPTNPQPGSYGSYSMGLPVQGRVWTPQQVATEVVNHIDQYFTFTGCGPTLYVGKTCDLNTDIGVPAPVQVIAINSTGFALKSLPGHPEGAGRTITFVFEANDVPGNLGLETLQVDAFGPLSNSSLLGPLNTEGTARPSWTIFADNISSRLPENPPPPGGVGPLSVPAKPLVRGQMTH